ncbi:MAG: hypothetical protein ACXV2E_06465 [Halobacteriota archaeon]
MDSSPIVSRVVRKAVHQDDVSVLVLREYETGWRSAQGNVLKRMYKIKSSS